MPETDTKNLFKEFPSVATTEWISAIIKDLKGADFDSKMVWKTSEGFNLNPFYREEDILNLKYIKSENNPEVSGLPVVRGYKTESNNWDICQEINVINIVEANKFAVDALKNGADSISFVFNEDNNIKQYALQKLLKGINIENQKLRFITNGDIVLLYNNIKQEFLNRKLNFKKANIVFDYAPICYLTIYGNSKELAQNNLLKYSELIKEVSENFKNIKIIGINANCFGDAGCLLTHELAYSIAIASEYLSLFSENGIALKNIAKQITFNYSTGSNYFLEIAKLRAARVLWEKLLEAFIPNNSEIIPMNIHSITTNWNKSIYDKYNNVLRQTTEAMSAIIGGTQSLTIRPFDINSENENNFTNRLSRNISIILKEEAHLNKVGDIAGGSYYIENITDNLVKKSWELFLEIEDKGGYIKAFKDGFIQEQIKKVQEQRCLSIANQKEVILGVNRYLNVTEKFINEVKNNNMKKRSDFEPINIFRGAQEIEMQNRNKLK
ncbi:MAG: hypothetical protein A2X08_16565 [Bacteroidetes bacterium GWA2_32_17]|nr:MAG: hypothetical protein A2X08_16565 [Bacteroidetes bacterium GWA2_32_17]